MMVYSASVAAQSNLLIEPAHGLRFGLPIHASPENNSDGDLNDSRKSLKKSNQAVLTLSNISSRKQVVFKVRTTHPEMFSVKPTQGILYPEMSIRVKLVLLVDNCRDVWRKNPRIFAPNALSFLIQSFDRTEDAVLDFPTINVDMFWSKVPRELFSYQKVVVEFDTRRELAITMVKTPKVTTMTTTTDDQRKDQMQQLDRDRQPVQVQLANNNKPLLPLEITRLQRQAIAARRREQLRAGEPKANQTTSRQPGSGERSSSDSNSASPKNEVTTPQTLEVERPQEPKREASPTPRSPPPQLVGATPPSPSIIPDASTTTPPSPPAIPAVATVTPPPHAPAPVAAQIPAPTPSVVAAPMAAPAPVSTPPSPPQDPTHVAQTAPAPMIMITPPSSPTPVLEEKQVEEAPIAVAAVHAVPVVGDQKQEEEDQPLSVQVEPKDVLEFVALNLASTHIKKEQWSTSMVLSNPFSNCGLLFKVKTTNVLGYLVKPSMGLIEANGSKVIQVLTHQTDDEHETQVNCTRRQRKDRFLIQVCRLSLDKYKELVMLDEKSLKREVASLWKEVQGVKKVLSCRFAHSQQDKESQESQGEHPEQHSSNQQSEDDAKEIERQTKELLARMAASKKGTGIVGQSANGSHDPRLDHTPSAADHNQSPQKEPEQQEAKNPEEAVVVIEKRTFGALAATEEDGAPVYFI